MKSTFLRANVLALASLTIGSMLNAQQIPYTIPALVGVLAVQEDTTEQIDEKEADAKSKDKDKPPKYDFEIDSSVEYTDVKSQGKTGTCWCFATTSFIESELMRRGKGRHDLSEMHVVKNVYMNKAQNYVLRHGKAQFSQGALAHDTIQGIRRGGLMPEEAFNGLDEGATEHSHNEMESVLTGMLDAVIKRPKPSPKWPIAFSKVLDTYLGSSPENFSYNNRTYTPLEFAKDLDFRAEDYVNLTSYTHHPFYESFVLEIPDNYSNGSFYNLPIEDLVSIIDHAIENGFSVAWDGDVSERGFSSSNGIAILPEDPNRPRKFKNIGPEKIVNQAMRQDTFHSYATTDDHLMHLVGISRDSQGNKYYVIKNSWGEVGPYNGLLHMSEAYVRLKTVAILLHKDAIPPKHRIK